MKRRDALLFVGFNRRVAALDKKTGEIRWEWKAPQGHGYVSLLLDGDRLFASADGLLSRWRPFGRGFEN